jgi:2-polyprenyl-3-methyl-5-hydroxy-6-metoxy-1,4-benzoquinol methylase
MKFNSVDSYGKECHKLELDQYYTSYDDMEYCVNKAWDVVKELGYGVSEFLEPSAGEGIFSDYLATSGLDVIAIDIDPKGEDIIKADFLTYELSNNYKAVWQTLKTAASLLEASNAVLLKFERPADQSSAV